MDEVGATYRFFADRLAALPDGISPADIEDALMSGLTVVCVTAGHGDNAYRIFESLNNTGLTLNQADLLRNYLFMHLPTRGEAAYESLWLPLQDSLDENLETLFWLDLVQRDPRAKQSDTYAHRL